MGLLRDVLVCEQEFLLDYHKVNTEGAKGTMRLTIFEFCEGVVLPDVQGRPRVPPTHREQKRLVVSGCLDLSRNTR